MKPSSRGARALLVALSLAGITAGSATAAPEDLANDVAAEISSPFCPGVTLHDCPSRAAADLRATIERWAKAGWGRARIMAELESEFGPSIRATPTGEGRGLIAWLLPAVAVVVGGMAALLAARRWTQKAGPDKNSGPSVHISPEERRRLDKELAAFKGDPWSR
jgi:cytochrome c-type biogenesis protein CcmH